MHITKISIRNILGIEAMDFDAGKFTAITGRNGSGKTSALEAIRAAISVGHDATLLRAGSEVGEAVLVLDDGTEIKKRITDAGTKVTISKDGMVAARPAETIRALTDALSVNPIDFLRASKKERAQLLIEAMPLQLDDEICRRIAGELLPASGDALARLDAARKAIYDERTGFNRAAKEKAATAAQLMSSLPAQSPELVSIDSIQAEISQAETICSEELDRIAKKLSELTNEHKRKEEDALKALESARVVRDAAVAAAAQAYQSAADQIQAAMNESRQASAGIESKADAARAKARQSVSEITIPLKTRIKEIQAARELAARYAQARETAERMQKDAAALEAQSQAASQAIIDLDAYRASLLGALPISGLVVADGEIMRGGILFDRLNSAQQVEIAVEVAKLRAGKLGVICVDGLELLDAAHFAEFRKQAEASGMQLIVTRATDGELVVESV